MRVPGTTAFFPLAVVAMLAGFTFWLENLMSEGSGGGPRTLRHDPDFWVENISLRRFDTEGTIQYTLHAKRMEHFGDDESTEVSAPDVVYFRSGQTTTMTARKAWLDKAGKNVKLVDDVRVVRTEPGKSSPALTIETPMLDVKPDDEVARTSAPVTLTQGKSVVHGAGGMELDNKTRIAVLNGPVTGTLYKEK